MRRSPITAAILTAGACALGLGAPATAQTTEGGAATPSSANAAALRYLSWPGRTYPPAGVAPAAVTTPRRPAIIPHGGWTPPEAAPPPVAPPQTAPQGLTPAPWIAPQPPAWTASQAPAYPPPSAAPRAYAAETAEAAPLPAAPAVAPAVAPAAAPAAASDPMAPRRDALIFRLQQPAAAPQTMPQPTSQARAEAQPAPAPDAPDASAPQGGGARYYSVHRQNGRQPDATPLPAPVYLDALPVDLTAMPASTDLAEPPAAPNLIRNANGRLQALPANEDPVLP